MYCICIFKCILELCLICSKQPTMFKRPHLCNLLSSQTKRLNSSGSSIQEKPSPSPPHISFWRHDLWHTQTSGSGMQPKPVQITVVCAKSSEPCQCFTGALEWNFNNNWFFNDALFRIAAIHISNVICVWLKTTIKQTKSPLLEINRTCNKICARGGGSCSINLFLYSMTLGWRRDRKSREPIFLKVVQDDANNDVVDFDVERRWIVGCVLFHR